MHTIKSPHNPQLCIFFKKGHKNHQCPAFKALDVAICRQQANSLRACYNCLSTRHRSRDCPSHGRCRECNGQHHSLLHIATHTRDSSAVTNASASTMNVAAADLPSRPCKSILRTAVALVNSGFRTATLMFDEGAEVSLITSSLARTINACFKPCSLRIDGVGPSVVTCRHTVDIDLCPIHREQPSSSTHPSPYVMLWNNPSTSIQAWTLPPYASS